MADSRSQEKSWTVGDLMKKSELIREGKPALYRLITTRSDLDESGKIRKWTFGQREINTQNKIILLVGETGTGKTTLINTIVNYTLGVKFEDHVWFEISDDSQNQTADQTESQTTEITVYEVFIQNNSISVTIIDTPGYGDTRGLEHDEIIADNLLKLFEHDTGVKEIDAVCLVVKATQNRLSDRQHYIFDAVLSLFGEDIEENIVIFATHSNGRPPKNVISAIKKMNVPCKKKNGTDPVFFLFDNCQAEEQTEEEEEDLKTWKLTEKSLKEFFTSLEIQNRKSLMKTKNVLIEQIRLKACVSNLRKRIQFKESKHDELKQIQKALKENQEKIQENGDCSFTVFRTHKQRVTSDVKVTSCNVCKENCHEECTMAINPSWCEVMLGENCTVCRGKCPHSKHVRENEKYQICLDPVKMTYTALIKQYESFDKVDKNLDSEEFRKVRKDIEQTKTEVQKKMSIEETLNKEVQEKMSIEEKLSKELTEVEEEKKQLIKEAGDTIKKLSEIALNPDSAFIVNTLDFLILRAEETGPSAWVKELKEMRKTEPAAQEGVAAALKYVGEGLTKGVKSFFTKK